MRNACLLLVLLTAFALPGHAQVEWSYHSPTSPSQWAQLSENFLTCDLGSSQSPLDIEAGENGGLINVSPPTNNRDHIINWKPSKLNLINNGHTIQANYDAGSSFQVEDNEYELKQFHFHSPSEHILNGRQYPLEAHFVHSSAQGLLVVGVFFETGNDHNELGKIWAHTPLIEGQSVHLSEDVFADQFLPSDKDSFTYIGSLTTPPCSEGVQWVVMKNPVNASVFQLQKLQRVFGGPNNRPVQAQNARLIEAHLRTQF